MRKKTMTSLLTVALLSLVGCGSETSSSISKSTSSSEHSTSSIESTSSSSIEEVIPEDQEVELVSTYKPSTIDTTTFKQIRHTLADGVEMYSVTYDLLGYENAKTIHPYYITVDLNKANVVAGSYNNTHGSDYYVKSTPVAMAKAYERDNASSKVLSTINADFFAWGDGLCCNAFVKDGVILKEAHNYNLEDVPASKPMLFGIKGNQAKIGPMTNYEDYEDNLKGTISDENVLSIISDGENILNTSFEKGLSRLTKNSQIGVVIDPTERCLVNASRTSAIYKFEVTEQLEDSFIATITEQVDVATFACEGNGKGYIVLGVDCGVESLKIGDSFRADDYGPWHGFDTVIGCRHSIIENGQIAKTISLEGKGQYEKWGNGVANRGPRSCLGVMNDGKVVILAIEDLHYGGKADICTGLNITQVADLMMYIGCVSAANLDGGGSTQLCTKTGYKGLGDYVVRAQSSDVSDKDPESSRSVLNSVLVVTR